MTVTDAKEMAAMVQSELAAESKREAKGVDWARYQAVCDELEGAQSDIEELEATISRYEQKASEAEDMLFMGNEVDAYKIIERLAQGVYRESSS
jgi:hypothetical protein